MQEFFKSKRVLVTGHTGFKGSWLCSVLLNMGATVCGYALDPAKPSLYDMLGLSERVEDVRGDVRCLEKLTKTLHSFKPDIAIHMAAQPLVGVAYSQPVETFDVNVMGTVNFLQASRGAKRLRSILIVATDKVYGGGDTAHTEDSPLCGREPYGGSKAAAEIAVQSFRESFFSSTAVSTARAGNAIGGGDFEPSRILPECAFAVREGRSAEIKNPSSVRPYQHVLDCIFGYLQLAKAQYEDKTLEGAYNFGGQNTTTGNLAQMFFDCLNGQKIRESREGQNDVVKIVSDKAKNKLNWTPQLSIQEAVRLTADFAKVWIANGNCQEIVQNQITDYLAERE